MESKPAEISLIGIRLANKILIDLISA